MKKIIRISTVPGSLAGLLKGQLRMLSAYYEVVAVSSPGEALTRVEEQEGATIVEGNDWSSALATMNEALNENWYQNYQYQKNEGIDKDIFPLIITERDISE